MRLPVMPRGGPVLAKPVKTIPTGDYLSEPTWDGRLDSGSRVTRRRTARTVSPYLLAGMLTATGALHFVVPKVFAAIVPPRLPAPYALVHLSGAAELACAAGLVLPRTRRAAGWGTAALFVAVFPANVYTPLLLRDRGAGEFAIALALLRLPLQVPLVWWAVDVARRRG